MRIQQVEALVGITRKNIRFYEDEGLLKPSRNAENGYRDYSDLDIDVLKRIKLLRKLAVPIEEIRRLLSGSLSLEDCMRRHIQSVDKQAETLRQVRNMCEQIARRGESLSSMDVEAYAAEMERMEGEGICFMDLAARDKKRRKRAPMAAAAVMVLLMAAVICLFVWSALEEPVPTGIAVIFIALPAVVIVGVLLALRERMQEIEKGEEDAASKY